MRMGVELQDMYSYSFIMMIVAAVLVVVPIIVMLGIIIKRKKKRKVKPIKEMTVETRENIKQKYFGQLNRLEKHCRDNKLSNRKAYQELSKITRHFVYEATGIKVHNYTLQEIKGTNLSGLYSIISECYTPEFSVDKNGDIYGSITKARKVIEEWN
ncbi:MAG: hypothetical protein IJA32_12820 [Lachnospiraceae bacterium]|nr:hypothetical protein [Lachnospiraceae bacterium]